LHSVLGPDGPLRIIGVDFELIPQCVHLYNHVNQGDSKTSNGKSKTAPGETHIQSKTYDVSD